MQFPVPQFTDVEDKIIAGLTFKQFGIIFGAAVFTFVIYVITKNIPITIGFGVLTGLPSLALVFGKLNGRPLYASAGAFIQYLFGAKVYTYHKAGYKEVEINTEIPKAKPEVEKIDRSPLKLKELTYALEQGREEENKILDIINKDKQK